jgi:inosose dehydratase
LQKQVTPKRLAKTFVIIKEDDMSSLKLGCQTYSWEMLGAGWQGTPEMILDAMAAAGYGGVEFSNGMIGRYLDEPVEFGKELKARKLACAAFAYARDGFTDLSQRSEDLAGFERALRFAAHFQVVLCLGGPSSPAHTEVGEKIANALDFYQEAARRAEKVKVELAIHPHSHHTSLVTTVEDYERLLTPAAAWGIGFNPDTGHILRSQQDLMACLQRYRPMVRHVHIKDLAASGAWAPLGQGVTPLNQVLGWLETTGYDGWVVIEEESDAVYPEPSAAVAANRRTIKLMGY